MGIAFSIALTCASTGLAGFYAGLGCWKSVIGQMLATACFALALFLEMAGR